MRFKCSVCKQDKANDSSLTTGYGINEQGDKACYGCCAIQDNQDMVDIGKATLYDCDNEVSNWPNSLKMPITYRKTGRHNFGLVRHDFWFKHEGRQWHGYRIGDMTQIAHCKRLKV